MKESTELINQFSIYSTDKLINVGYYIKFILTYPLKLLSRMSDLTFKIKYQLLLYNDKCL